MTWMQEDTDHRDVGTPTGDARAVESQKGGAYPGKGESFVNPPYAVSSEVSNRLMRAAADSVKVIIESPGGSREPRPPFRSQMADQVRGALDVFERSDPDLARELDAQVAADRTFGRFSDHR